MLQFFSKYLQIAQMHIGLVCIYLANILRQYFGVDLKKDFARLWVITRSGQSENPNFKEKSTYTALLLGILSEQIHSTSGT